MGEAARWLESLILQMAVLCGAQWHWAGSLTCCLPPLLSRHLLLLPSRITATKMDTSPLDSPQILRGCDRTLHLAHRRKCQCLGSCWWRPFATVRSRDFLTDVRDEQALVWGWLQHVVPKYFYQLSSGNHQPHTADQPLTISAEIPMKLYIQLLRFSHKITAHCRIFVSDFITAINYHIGTWLLTQRKLALTPIIIFMGSKNTP